MGEPTDELIRELEQRRESLGAVVAELEQRLRPARVRVMVADRLRLWLLGVETRFAARTGVSPRVVLLLLVGGLVAARIVRGVSRLAYPGNARGRSTLEGRWSWK